MTTVSVPRSRMPGERRVSATPDAARQLVEAGVHVLVEAGAGAAAGYPDAGYEDAGARVSGDIGALWSDADIVITVGPLADNADLGGHEVDALAENAVVVGFLAPHRDVEVVRTLAERKITACALELVPRISRAQRMDALSSQANLAGYRAGVTAAYRCDKHFPLSMTAAGTVRPARLVVLGAGVAGLQRPHTADPGHGLGDAAGLCGARPRGGGGRQLRADPRRRGGRPRGRARGRRAPARLGARARVVPAVRPQHPGVRAATPRRAG
ncbi:MAG: hypothetical protein WD080_12965, partial [Egibacteraceae bacterium]